MASYAEALGELRKDRQMVLAAVNRNGIALKFASIDLQADRDVALAAVSQNGLALKFVANTLRADREVVLAAASKDSAALEYAADELLEDDSFARSAKKKYWILKIVTLAGKSCILLIRAKSRVRKEDVIRRCAPKLGLDNLCSSSSSSNSSSSGGVELVSGTSLVPETARIEVWPGLDGPGQVCELQLILTKRPKREAT
mmetsp:Transcript_9581/g.21388  ORF Transcript_9581/g.21388 Transcript_9581/m.21388 type:complete len:200 (-) Transcript_9581:141-740(-)